MYNIHLQMVQYAEFGKEGVSLNDQIRMTISHNYMNC